MIASTNHQPLKPVRLIHQKKLPTLLDIWMEHHYSEEQRERLAFFAGVSHTDLLDMFCCIPVPREQAQKVLYALSGLLHRKYNLSNVAVVTEEATP